MRRIEAVTFDVGKTLMFNPEPELRRRRRSELKKWLRRHGAAVDRERLGGVVTYGEWLVLELREEDARTAADRAAEQVAAALVLALTGHERRQLASLLDHLSDASCYRPAEGVLDALRSLRAQGVRLGIVSTRGSRSGRMTMRYLERSGLASFFEPAAIAWSDEVGCAKPDPRIFLAALRGLGVPPQRAAHVGNNRLADVLGARRLGMVTVRYAGVTDSDGYGPEADAVIRHYEELAAALGLSAAVERSAA
jgi:HAD superfamily hydrolase (TIGR01549 family)